jgi:Asp-tRNA(Asn)/Glu-tRNA(Gln) amidotransferase A subunit family amidase
VITAIGAPERAPQGPLRGEPVAIKDNIDMAGIVTTNASLVGDAEPAASDAEVVARLRAAGAELFCKTNLLEHAAGSVSPAFGMTRNPHDRGRTSGGSSGGSAALVAAGVCDLAVGTDSGGSIRIPASYCGIVGLKPTYGLVPVAGTNPLSPSCDHVGTLTRTAALAARLLAAMAEVPDVPDPASPRLGVLGRELDDPDLEPDVRARVLDAVERLHRLGFDVRPIDIPELAIADDTLGTVILREASDRHREWFAESADLYGPGTRALLELGARIDDTAYRDALAAMARIAEAYDRTFSEVDLLAGPTACFVAPPEDPSFGTAEGSIEGRFTGPANLAGVPALSTPCGLAGGMPVGLQLTAARGHDSALLRAARAFEEATR